MKAFLKPGIHWLSIFVPISFLINYIPALYNEIALFICSCLAMVALSNFISTATEHLASRVGAKVGGLLNATFSNLPEIIFGTVALYHGLTPLVKAAMTGAIIGNLLFVLGHSMLAGGLKNGVQHFSATRASDFSTGLIIATMALLIPATLHFPASLKSDPSPASLPTHAWLTVTSENVSLWVAIMLFIAYLGSLIFTLFSAKEKDSDQDVIESSRENEQNTTWSVTKSGVVLGISSLLIAFISDYVAGSIDVVEKEFHLTELFMGVIVIAILGNVSAQTTAVRMAMKNKMNLCLEVAVSASSQVALLVVPLLVFASNILGHPISLEFTVHEIVAVGGAVWITSEICQDGNSNWLNGLQMLVLYAIVAGLFFVLPG